MFFEKLVLRFLVLGECLIEKFGPAPRIKKRKLPVKFSCGKGFVNFRKPILVEYRKTPGLFVVKLFGFACCQGLGGIRTIMDVAPATSIIAPLVPVLLLEQFHLRV